MAGHSKFKNIVHRKTAQDKKRAKIFSKIIRELTVAAKGGEDPAANPRLRTAISSARAENMPKDTMERAIKRGAGGEDDTNYEEVRYEGYGPGGTAIIVEALTDNRNRTAAEVRVAFTKYGGNLGETNSVTFMFDRLGVVEYPAQVGSADEMFEAALEAGANNVESDEQLHAVQCEPSDLNSVQELLSQKFGSPQEARLTWVPKNRINVDKDQATTLFKMINLLEDNEDVQAVDCNFEVDEAILDELDL